jgi:hypothetical protein
MTDFYPATALPLLTNSSVALFAKFEHGNAVRGIVAASRFFSATKAKGEF